MVGSLLGPAQALAGGTITPNPSSLVYGNVGVGSQSPLSTTLSNTTDNMIGDDTITGANASEFSTDSACDGATVGPGNPCTIEVTFAPTSPGSKSAVLHIPNDGSNPDVQVPLSGTGVNLSLTVAPAAFDFGTVAPGMQSAPQTFTATSDGSGAATVSQVNIAGANADQFLRTGGTCGMPPFQLNPTTSCMVDVAFAPTSAGAKAATLQFTSNAPDSPDTSALSGSGPAPPAAGGIVPLLPPPATTPPQRKCKKGQKLRKGKCVKKKRRKKP